MDTLTSALYSLEVPSKHKTSVRGVRCSPELAIRKLNGLTGTAKEERKEIPGEPSDIYISQRCRQPNSERRKTCPQYECLMDYHSKSHPSLLYRLLKDHGVVVVIFVAVDMYEVTLFNLLNREQPLWLGVR